jgi:hypothetical protein
VTTKTLCRRLFGLVGRVTPSARRLTLHLPADWPWVEEFKAALARPIALAGAPRGPLRVGSGGQAARFGRSGLNE